LIGSEQAFFGLPEISPADKGETDAMSRSRKSKAK